MFGFGAKKKPASLMPADMRAALENVEESLRDLYRQEDPVRKYLTLMSCRNKLAEVTGDILHRGKKGLGAKHFWTGFGMSAPLAIGLLFLEPVSGTLNIVSAVLVGFYPSVVIKRILDDSAQGKKSMLASLSPQIETLAAVDERVVRHMRQVEQEHLSDLRRLPSLREAFTDAGQTPATVSFADKVSQYRQEPPPRARHV